MKKGIPLDDEDQWHWLQKIHQLALNHSSKGAVIACSALKKKYRQVIRTSANVVFIYLKADKKIIANRLSLRKNHFMASSLINSQFATLEIPKNGLLIDATESFKNNTDLISIYLKK